MGSFETPMRKRCGAVDFKIVVFCFFAACGDVFFGRNLIHFVRGLAR